MNCIISSKHHCDFCSDGHPGSTCKAATWTYKPRHTENTLYTFSMTRKYQHSFIKGYAFILNGKDIVEFIHVLVDFMGNKLWIVISN